MGARQRRKKDKPLVSRKSELYIMTLFVEISAGNVNAA
jgi:hypothetical protein